MSAHYQRACLLYQQNRYDMAASELRLALSQEPNRPDYHALLALCLTELERFDDATEEAQHAIGLGPDLPYSHYVMSRVMLERNRLNEARTAIQEAIRLDPEDADYFHQLSVVELNARKWQAALDAADQGLQQNPEHVGCTNMRVRALAQLGRKIDADAAVEAALHRAPENAFTHANRGWTLLEQGNPAKAMEHFREALRLDPTMDWARQGIVESLKARHFIYRWMLAYFLWSSRLSSQAQWGIMVGGYVAFRVLNNLANQNPALNIIARPALIAYMIFALLTWIAQPLFNTLLRFNKFGRMVLSREEVIASNFVCLTLIPAVGFGLYYAFSGDEWTWAACMLLGFTTLFTAATFRCPFGWPRLTMAASTAAFALLSITVIVLLELATHSPPPADDHYSNLADTFARPLIPAAILLQFVAAGLAQARPKR